MSLDAAKSELRAASRAIENMKNAQSFEVFEEEWRDFLNCIEKSWNKVERGCLKVKNKFQPWQGKYTKLRKKDMLLRYLKQARDADNHSIQDIAEIKPGHRTMNFVNPTGGYIKSMRIENGQVTHYEGDPMIVQDHPPTVMAVRVKNSGSWYNPPNTHLGKKLNSEHPVEIAELGIQFYENYIAEVESNFFN